MLLAEPPASANGLVVLLVAVAEPKERHLGTVLEIQSEAGDARLGHEDSGASFDECREPRLLHVIAILASDGDCVVAKGIGQRSCSAFNPHQTIQGPGEPCTISMVAATRGPTRPAAPRAAL